MKHKLNSKSQAGTNADACKIAENVTSSQPIANARVARSILFKNVKNIVNKFNAFEAFLVSRLGVEGARFAGYLTGIVFFVLFVFPIEYLVLKWLLQLYLRLLQ